MTYSEVHLSADMINQQGQFKFIYFNFKTIRTVTESKSEGGYDLCKCQTESFVGFEKFSLWFGPLDKLNPFSRTQS